MSVVKVVPGAGVHRSDEGVVEAEALRLGALVAKLAFQAEHAEVVAADQVDVVAVLVLYLGDGGGSEVDRSWSADGGKIDSAV